MIVKDEKLITRGAAPHLYHKHRKNTLLLPLSPPVSPLLLYTYLQASREDTLMLVVMPSKSSTPGHESHHMEKVLHHHSLHDPPPCSLGHQPLNTELPSSDLGSHREEGAREVNMIWVAPQ